MKDRSQFIDYLRTVHSVYLSRNILPIQGIEIQEILGKEWDPNIFVPFNHIKPGSTPFADLAALAALTRKKQASRIFEIGTFEGLATVVFAKNSKPNIMIFTLDLPADEKSPRTRRSFEAQSVSERYQHGCLIDIYGCNFEVEKLFGDSALFDYRGYYDSIDLFFIDGAHTADYVIIDSRNAFRSVTKNGWVIWHDCFVPDVFKVIKMIARYHPIKHIRGTNLALTMEKPSASFPWKILEKKLW